MTRRTRTTRVRFAVGLAAVLTAAAGLVISSSGRANAFQLLTSSVGWQAESGRLFWTNDAGAHWTDISPPIPRRVHGSHGETELQELTSVFFLNTQVGWALYSYYDGDATDARFTLASTTDSGRDWTVWPLQLPPRKQWLLITPGAQIAFADRLNGWMEAQPPHGSFIRPGVLLMTADGGRTWKFAPSNPGSPPGQRFPGVGGGILVRSPHEVWLAGGVDGDDLYVTRDAAMSWQKISLPAPSGIYPARLPAYDLPIFENEKDGYEAVTYATPNFGPGSPGNGDYGRSAAVLFVTRDGGANWKPDRIVTNLKPVARSYAVASTVAGNEWILVFERPINPNRPFETSPPLLLKVGPGEKIKASGDIASANFAPGLSFVSPTLGVVVGARIGPVLTTDGGATWKPSSPFPRLPSYIYTIPASPRPTEGSAPSGTLPEVSVGSAKSQGAGVSRHLGFDTSTPPLARPRPAPRPCRIALRFESAVRASTHTLRTPALTCARIAG